MNKFSKIFVAGVLATSALGATAYAGGANSYESAFQHTYDREGLTVYPQDTAYGYSYQPHFLSKQADQNAVKVFTLDEVSRAEAAQYRDNAAANPAGVASLQSQIRQDTSLLRALKSKNVNVANIIGKRTAANGDVSYVIR